MENQPNTTEPAKEVFSTGAVRSQIYPKETVFPVRGDLVFCNHVGFRRLSEAYGEGSLKYNDNNWMKGFPESVMLSHCIEHIRKHCAGDRTEDHLAHACWNLYTLMYFQELRPELMDLTGKLPQPVAPVEISEEDTERMARTFHVR